ncbi:MAG: endonuclease MutS2 [Thermoplasmata archaeon]
MLEALEAIGPKTRQKLLETFGSEEELIRAAEDLQLHRFQAIRGISSRRAVDIISGIMGVEAFPFVKTEAAQGIYEDILRRIQAKAHTSYTRNRVLLLRPLRDMGSRETLLGKVMAAKERARQLPQERVASLLTRLPALKDSKPVFDSSKVVVVEDVRTLRRLEPYTRYCEVLMPDDLDRPDDYDLILYVCTSGSVAFEGIDQLHVVLGRPEPWQLFPEAVLDFFRANEDLLQVLRKLGAFVEGMEVAEEILKILSSLRLEPPILRKHDLEDLLRRLNETLKERLSRLSLQGEEVLEVLQKGLPRRLEEVFLEVTEEGEEEILKQTGLRVKLDSAYPLALEEEDLEKALRDSRQRAKMKAFETLQRTAGLLSVMEEDVRRAHRKALEFDFDMALGSFALEYDLLPPRWGSGLRLKGALHLALIDAPEAQRVDYRLSPPESVALLTGANSGGKTTLLETVAQVHILAAMGLPVNAREAVLEPVDACYFFSRQKPLSAGALEGFLTTFMPLALDESRKLVLADELEAMTEPEAAAAIIATFLDLMKESDSYAIIVTHAARSILQLTDVRVDGIEAQGLDEDYNLLVDRTPKPGHIARSTPELILKRLMGLRRGEEAGLYDMVLRRFNSRVKGTE